MLPLLDNKIFDEGFCWGEDEATITDGDRLRLNDDIVDVLKKHKVKTLYRFPDPTGAKVILCPPKYHVIYMKTAEQKLPKDMDRDEAYRKFIFSGKLAAVKMYNRIRIPKTCMKRAKLKTGTRVVILGVGYWYELWREEVLENKETQ